MVTSLSNAQSRLHSGWLTRFLLSRNFLVSVIVLIGFLPTALGPGWFFINGDILAQYATFTIETKRMLENGAPLWCWNMCLGDNFLVSFSYYTLTNPFALILTLLPYGWIAEGVAVAIWVKFLICGYVSDVYFRKMGFSPQLSKLGALLFTFSSWVITGLCYGFFIEPVILFVILLIAVERFIRRDSFRLSFLTLAFFGVMVINFYFAYITILCAVIYYFCRVGCSGLKPVKILNDTLLALLAFFVAVGLAAVVLLPIAFYLMGNERFALNGRLFDIFNIADRFFWLVFPKITEGHSHYIFFNSADGSNAANVAVFGVFPAILLFFKRANGLAWLKWLIGVSVVFYLTPLTSLFSLFTSFHYTRWAYLLSLALTLAALYYIRDFGLPKRTYLFAYVLIVALFIGGCALASIHYMCAVDDGWQQDCTAIVCHFALVTLNLLALVFLCTRRSVNPAWYIGSYIAVCVCVSCQFVLYTLVRMDVSPLAFSHANDYKDLNWISATEFFRTHQDEKEIDRKDAFVWRTDFYVQGACENFGLLYNRASVAEYNSLRNVRLNDWYRIFGKIGSDSNFENVKFVDSFDALMSVKRLICIPASDFDSMDLPDSEPIFADSWLREYDYEYYIPMGFAYDTYIDADAVRDSVKAGVEMDYPLLMLNHIAVEKEDIPLLSQYLTKGSIDSVADLGSAVDSRRAFTCSNFKGDSRGFEAAVYADSPKVLFFSVLSDPGFSATIDGVAAEIFPANLGFSAVVVPQGQHVIKFSYMTPALCLGAIISAVFLVITALLFFAEYRRRPDASF